jgi:arylsulfatase A-like enzyme
VVLLDSLRRDLIEPYAGHEFATPNLTRFARRAVRFDRHYAGSLPCIPARHDILCGALDFLWKPWGSIELWEEPITVPLRRAGVVTKLVTDHPHLFESGGENYHTDFTAWEYERGHESDRWRTRPDPSWVGAPSFGRGHMPYDDSRGYFKDEADFPGPRTMSAAARWLEADAPQHDRFLLFVDEFDPHEPFDTPEPYASMYDPAWSEAHLIWPPYVAGGIEKGVLTAAQARQVRACYGAKLTMIDAWLGRVLEALDRAELWSTTAVIVSTDHGLYLGEKDLWGKPGVPVYQPLGQIPLLVWWPGVPAGTCSALTTSVDLHATLADLFGVATNACPHGHSLLPLLRGEVSRVREWVLAGIYGRHVQLVQERFKYVRGPEGENAPLSLWSNRWSTMPIPGLPELRLPPPDERAFLDRMPGRQIPVLRQPFMKGDELPYWSRGVTPGNLLFDLEDDPTEDQNLAATAREKEAAESLRAALLEIQAPSDQLERLGFR